MLAAGEAGGGIKARRSSKSLIPKVKLSALIPNSDLHADGTGNFSFSPFHQHSKTGLTISALSFYPGPCVKHIGERSVSSEKKSQKNVKKYIDKIKILGYQSD